MAFPARCPSPVPTFNYPTIDWRTSQTALDTECHPVINFTDTLAAVVSSLRVTNLCDKLFLDGQVFMTSL